ncbi:phosphatase PAP2 family protein [Lacticaseibacillus sp. GG6-2]
MKTKTQTMLGALLLALFAELALGVHTQAAWVRGIDAAFASLATKAITPLNTTAFKLVGTLGSPATVIGLTCLLCLWLWVKRDLSLAVWVGGLQLGGSAIAELCKQLVARLRPGHQLVADSGFSFPSGHTFCTAILVCTVLMLLLPLIQSQEGQLVAVLIGIVWVALVAISRVYLRDHFATDVFGSLLLASGYWLVVTPYADAMQTFMRRIFPERMQTLWLHKN